MATIRDARGRRLRAALGFLRLPPTEPELQLLHRWLDTWTGVGLITVGVERYGMRLSLSHIADGEWRAIFMGDPMISARGFGVAATPWRAVQRAAWGAVGMRRSRCCAVEKFSPESLVMMQNLRSRAVWGLLVGVMLVLSMSAADWAGAVESGQPAPEFKLPSTLGNDIALSDFRGKKWVLLEFYSADFAPS